MERTEYQQMVIQDVINLYKKDELNISPWYQRRSVWITNQKSYLINTLFEQKPIPAIYVRHSLDLEKGKSIKEVVDGQQRVRCIIEYCDNNFTARHPNYPKKIKFSELNRKDKQQFLLTSLSIGYLLGASDGDVIDIFGRINSVAKTLNGQEKRNAGFSGEFKQFCLKYASSKLSFWRDYNVFTANNIARMGEVQFISEVVINLKDGITLTNAAKIYNYYKAFDDSFAQAKQLETKLEKIFYLLISIEPAAIKDTIFNRHPILFSLIIALQDNLKVKRSKLENALVEIDAIYNKDIPMDKRPRSELEFIDACRSTTQGISQRKIRDKFIRKFIQN